MVLFLCPGLDCVDSFVSSDLAAGEAEFEAESWSLSVEHKFCKKQDKQEVKRQDVIYGEETPEICLLLGLLLLKYTALPMCPQITVAVMSSFLYS